MLRCAFAYLYYAKYITLSTLVVQTIYICIPILGALARIYGPFYVCMDINYMCACCAGKAERYGDFEYNTAVRCGSLFYLPIVAVFCVGRTLSVGLTSVVYPAR